MLTNRSIFAFLLLVALPTTVFASHTQSKWAVGGAIGQAFPTGPRMFPGNESKELHGSVWARHYFKPELGVELNYNGMNFAGRSNASDANVNALSLNLVSRCLEMKQWVPVVALGLGVGNISDYGTKTYQEMMALLRAGVEYDVIENLAIGAHLQFSYLPETSSHAASEIHALSYLLSLTYNFGDSASAHVAEAAAPLTPLAPVQSGPVDTDGDGVADNMDKCNSSAPGAKVNAYGCDESEKAQFKLNLVFPPGKAVLTADQMGKVEELAAFLKSYPETQVTIEGHTDNTGSEAMNKKISAARAEAVRQGLHKDFAIDLKRIVAKGFGSAMPVASNATPEGREQNRRVIATISQGK